MSPIARAGSCSKRIGGGTPPDAKEPPVPSRYRFALEPDAPPATRMGRYFLGSGLVCVALALTAAIIFVVDSDESHGYEFLGALELLGLGLVLTAVGVVVRLVSRRQSG